MDGIGAGREGKSVSATVVAVCRSSGHTFTKLAEERIQLLEGLGVEGDAHMGKTVQHLSRLAKDPDRPNLRQVHLIHEELFYELRKEGYEISPGQMGENITTSGVDLLGLPAGALLQLGDKAVVKVTGLRDPCYKLDQLQAGLMGAVLSRDRDGRIVRKSGIMGVVVTGGEVKPGDRICVRLPEGSRMPLEVV